MMMASGDRDRPGPTRCYTSFFFLGRVRTDASRQSWSELTMLRRPKSDSETRNGGYRFLAAFAAGLFVWSLSTRGADVEWRSGYTDIAQLDQAELATALTDLASRPNARHVVVQFDRPIGPGVGGAGPAARRHPGGGGGD